MAKSDVSEKGRIAMQTSTVSGGPRLRSRRVQLSHVPTFSATATGAVLPQTHETSPLARAATLWQEQGCSEGLLWHGLALDRANKWARDHSEALTEVEEDFLRACHEAESHARKEEHHASLLALLSGLMIIASLLAVRLCLQAMAEGREQRAALAGLESQLDEEREARDGAVGMAALEAEARRMSEIGRAEAQKGRRQAVQDARLSASRALAAEAQLAASDKPQLALLLAVESAYAALRGGDRAGGSEATRALYRALGHDNWQAIASGDAQPKLACPAWLSPHGRLFTASATGDASLWDAVTGRKLADISGSGGLVGQAAWSPDGSRIAVGYADGQAVILDVETGQMVGAIPDGWRAAHLAWNPVRPLIGVLTDLDMVGVWDAEAGSLDMVPGGDMRLKCVWWSADGDELSAVAGDGTAVVWAVVDGAPPQRLSEFASASNCFGSSETRTLSAASWDGGEHVYLTDLRSLAGLACTRVTRNLTADEWVRYLGPDVPYRTTCSGR